jgi:hypothetical protein
MNYSIRIVAFFIGAAIMSAFAASYAGYGDVSGGLPSWKERQILVLTNACRMSPVQYRDAYVGNYAILDSSKYPPVKPLYLNPRLNASARGHALDMGDTCGIMQHNSCNGTAWNMRIKSYYQASSSIGENIAVGNNDPFVTMNQWIMDTPQGSNQPAADFSWCKASTGDSSRCDGHRSNIMNNQYKEMGTGYTYGANAAVSYHHFWVQDFGGGKPAFSSPIVGGAHFLRESAKTNFLANYWDQTLKAPAEASVYLSGQKYAMTLTMGKAFQGTYELTVARGSGCRTYYFSFLDGSGNTWRYPEQGLLVTTGEGGCTSDYENPAKSTMQSIPPDIPQKAYTIKSTPNRFAVIISAAKGMPVPQSATLFDGNGKTLCKGQLSTLDGASVKEERRMKIKTRITHGVYFIVLRISDVPKSSQKIILAR